MAETHEQSDHGHGLGVAEAPADDDTLVQADEQLQQSLALSHRHSGPPAQVPGYVMGRPLGEGAFGSVWLAEERNTGKRVAIKFYTHRRGLDWSLLNREVEKLAVLYTSRNIVRLLDVGWDSDPPYYVMEYLENGSLAQALADGPISPDNAVRMARGILQALVHAHNSGILHCDLKPANVLLDGDHMPRLCDFGQSRLSDEQDPALGTLFYMAPEQADLKAVPDARWDVYALGALLYHMLCDAPPFRTEENEHRIRSAETLAERLTRYRQLFQCGEKPTGHRKRTGVDRRLAEIVDRCLEPDPEKRYPNAQAVLDALERREQHLARRPLVALGFIGPLLLLAAMAFLVWDLMQTAVGEARKNVTGRALESNALPANILARSLDRELDLRQAELVEVAKDERLRAAILQSAGKSWEERKPDFKFLGEIKQQINDRRKALGLSRDASWFVTDGTHQGKQLWRDPHRDTIDNHYAWRHYFHGNTDVGDYDKDDYPTDLVPHPDPFISIAFRSEATDRFMVTIRAPVWDETGTRVIGVLGRTMHLDKLLADFEEHIKGNGNGDGDDVDRHIALIDVARGQNLLDHPWMNQSPEELERIPDETFEKLRLVGPMAQELVRAANRDPPELVQRDDYADPVGSVDPDHFGGRWLAAFAPVGETGWYAVVQERHASAGAPVDEMRNNLVRYGAVALAISCGLILLLWSFVQRELSDRSPRPWTLATGSRRSLAADTEQPR